MVWSARMASPSPRADESLCRSLTKWKKLPALDAAHAHAKLPQVGIILDHEQLWSFKTMPQAKRWNAIEMITAMYGAVARLGLPVTILHPDLLWPDDLKLIIAPALQLVDQPLIDRLSAFARAGGHLLLTCRTALMNRNGHLWEGPDRRADRSADWRDDRQP